MQYFHNSVDILAPWQGILLRPHRHSPDEERVEHPSEECANAKDGENTDVRQKSHDRIERTG
jgi:hypothetical protein